MTATNDALASIALATQVDLDDAISALAEITDTIILATNEPEFDKFIADTMLALARQVDPTDSHFAAEIRDTLRDNTNWSF